MHQAVPMTATLNLLGSPVELTRVSAQIEFRTAAMPFAALGIPAPPRLSSALDVSSVVRRSLAMRTRDGHQFGLERLAAAVIVGPRQKEQAHDDSEQLHFVAGSLAAGVTVVVAAGAFLEANQRWYCVRAVCVAMP